MSTTHSDLCRKGISRLLAYRAGGAPDAGRVAEVTLGIWQQMADQLVPVIGSHGVAILLSHALHLTSTNFPWFAIAKVNGDSAALQASLKTSLAGRDRDAIAAASNALLVNVIEILITLIGGSLTERLLAPVWETPSPTAEKTTSS